MLKKVIALLLAVCLMPAAALGEPDTPYPAGLMLRYHMLTDAQRAVFDLLYAGAAAGAERVELPQGTSYDDTVAAMDALLDDCPELCALGSSYSVQYYQQEPGTATAVDLTWELPPTAHRELMERALLLASQVQGDAYSRELYLHDQLCAGTVYDLSAQGQSTAWGALVGGRAACEGYARAMVLLCRLAGIPCGLVSGTAYSDGVWESHAWCILSVGGVLTQADPTWNDQDHMGVNTRWYFNLTDAQMRADHAADAGILWPACTDASASWHAREGWVVPAEGGNAVLSRALRLMATEKAAVNLRFEDAAAAAAFAENTGEYIVKYNEENPDAPFWGSYGVTCSYTQGCVMLMPGQ